VVETFVELMDFVLNYFVGERDLGFNTISHTPIGVCPSILCPLFDK